MSDWRLAVHTFCTPASETHEVNGEKLKFYPVSYKKLMELRKIGRPLVLAVTRLFSNDKSDVSSTVRDFNDPQTGKRRGSEVVSESITIEVLQYREQQREMAIDGLVDAVSQDANMLVIGEIVMDSLRDIFPRHPNKDEVSSFLFGEEADEEANTKMRPGLDPGTIYQLCEGVFKANRRIFDPLLARAQKWAEGLGINLGEKVKGALQPTFVKPSDFPPNLEKDQNPNQEEQQTGVDSSSSTQITNTGEN